MSSIFKPNAGGEEDDLFMLTAKCESLFSDALNKLFNEDHVAVELKYEENNETKQIFDKHGSDKCQGFHKYHLVYDKIFQKLKTRNNLNILEIGLGTDDPTMASNMSSIYSEQAKPGASLRAFKEMFPSANIYGADIDKKILFSEERIQTSYVDQLDFASFQKMQDNFNCPEYDLILEDGLHSITSSIYTLAFGLKSLKNNGIIILEDLPSNLTFWNFISSVLMRQGYYSRYIYANGNIFLASKDKTLVN